MECLQFDWKNIDDTFERDEFYENIQAPKWIDFTAPVAPADDHEWFCGKAGCTHVKDTLRQTEDSVLSDPQKGMSSQATKKAPPLAENTLSGTAGKRARGVVSSSYSSVSGIKEAFAKHKVLHLAKIPCVLEGNKHAVKGSMNASENQNPNQTCEAQHGLSRIPIFKASEGLAKKMKTTESKHVAGKQTARKVLAGVSKSTCSTLSDQASRSSSRAILDVTKSTIFLEKKDVLQKKSIISRIAVKEQDTHVLADVCSTSELKNKKAEATRTPFSVYTSRSATTSSLAMPPKKPTIPARSLQNVQLGNEKAASCRPPRVIARKGYKVGVESASVGMQSYQTRIEEGTLTHTNLHVIEEKIVETKHTTSTLNKRKLEDDAVLAYAACMQEQQTFSSNDAGLVAHEEIVSAQPMVQEQCPTLEDKKLVTSMACNGQEQPSHFCQENGREGKRRHALMTEKDDSVQSDLEKQLENLCLLTPSNKLAPHTQGHCALRNQMNQLDHSNSISKQEMEQEKHLENLYLLTPTNKLAAHTHEQCTLKNERGQLDYPDNTSKHVDSVVELKMVPSQKEDCASASEMEVSCHVESANKHTEVLSHHVDNGQSINCPSQMGTLLTFPQAGYASYEALRMSESFVDCMHTTEEPAPMSCSKDSERRLNQLQPVKELRKIRGLKRKSSELNFKVNCSSKDHRHESHQVPICGAVSSSLICQQTKQVSSTKSLMKPTPPHGSNDSCEEQHKKIKTTKVQPFKPFRLRTEERGALRELGLGRKEQGVSNTQELVHHALRMPSFGHPFRPQRSTKKLTVPKEPNFHSTRTRKTCTGHTVVTLAS
eukprot:c24840_g2_i1 orf=728-3208(+)